MNLSLENPLAPSLPVACALMGVLGAMIGSFLNVVIHRLPREQSIVFPNSTCPKCRSKIRAYDNIPILSFRILRGQCRACGAPISARYPAVEALTALLFVVVTWHDGWSFGLAFDLAFAASILALIFIDAEHMILPNAITYPGILFAVISRAVIPYFAGPAHFDDLPQLITLFPPAYPAWAVSLIGAAIGALAGGGSLWLMGFLWEKLRGVEAMGLGDVKMMSMVGAYLGWRLTILTILIGALSGSLVSLLIGARIIEWYASQFH